MKSLSIILSLFIISFSQAHEYFIYTHVSQERENLLKEIDPNAKWISIFSPSEIKNLKQLGISEEVHKLTTTIDLKDLKTLLPKLRIEPTGSFQLNDYSSYQWALNNPGGVMTRWISDIDQRLIYADESEDINLSGASEIAFNKIKVAIIDSGIDLNHPDLKGQLRFNEKECQSLAEYKTCLANEPDKNICHEKFANIDNDQNGYPLDCHGWSFTNTSYPLAKITGNPELTDSNGHGTHVAGIIGANKNAIGVNGIISNVELIPIQVGMNSSAENPIENIAKGVLYAIQNNAQVINLSLGWNSQFDLKIMRDLIAAAIKKNILVVIAAGNTAHDDISYPCAYDDVICVGAHDPSGALTNFSNFGTQVDLIAPGDRILSTWPTTKRSSQFTVDDDYEYLSGTSQAAPIVSGIAAKLLNQGFTPEQVFLKLLTGARDKNEKNFIRFGNVDFQGAMNSKTKNLLYPLNKTPFLIKWTQDENHKFILRLKNYGAALEKAKIKIESLSSDQVVKTTQFELSQIKPNDIIEKEIQFTDKDQENSVIYFSIKIITENSERNYFIKTQFIRLIGSETSDDDIRDIPVLAKLEEDLTLKAFETLKAENNHDFFTHHLKNQNDYISILKYTESGYIRSRPLRLKDQRPVFLNFSKLDIDLDGADDYIIMYVITNSEGNKITKFLVFDQDLNPKRYLISPNNEFNNEVTFIPGKFIWLKTDQFFAPAWVGYGEDPTPQTNPWEAQENTYNNYFYMLKPKGLEVIELPSQLTPLNTLYQNTFDKENGSIDLLATEDLGFLKTYFHLRFEKSLQLVQEVITSDYFDIADLKPLPLIDNVSNGFFHEPSILGGENIFTIKANSQSIETDFIHIPTPIMGEFIQFVHFISDDYILTQTDYKLALIDRKQDRIQTLYSKVDAKRKKYINLDHAQALYLPTNEAPGMTSEFIVVKNTQKLISHRQYRTLAIDDCEQMGVIDTPQMSQIAFVCKKSQKIKLLEINN